MKYKWLFALLCAVCGHAANPSFAGSKACAPCHPAQAKTQFASAHASALFHAAKHPLASSFAGQKLQRNAAYRFDFVRTGDGLEVRIDDGGNLMTLPVEWAFGAGRQAVTFVSRVNASWYVEYYASYYSTLGSFAATPGQDAVKPASIQEAAGALYKIHDPQDGISGCFECHSTGPVSFDDSGAVRLAEAGVRCEACHGAGSAHIENPGRHKLRNPATLSASALNRFCGACHRPPSPAGVVIDWNYAWNVRHQPMYLSRSRCFLKSAQAAARGAQRRSKSADLAAGSESVAREFLKTGGALSCLTCHDPHKAATNQPAAFYNQKCAGCHSTPSNSPAPVCFEQKPANCIDCHMPRVSPQTGLHFTNHWIGIYRQASMLKPVR